MKRLLLLVVATMLAFNWLSAEVEAPSGTGTSDDPYQIATLENIIWLSETSTAWDKHISQTADINASETETFNDGKGFSPIGDNALPFSGVYMGNGHIIDSLFINRPEQDYIGFFGVTKASSTTTITQLGLTNIDITGHDHTGGFLGTGETNSTTRAIISECFVTGEVIGNYCIGGFVGHAKSAQITNCYSIVEVSATSSYCGGFTGSSWYGLITNCYSTGKISAYTSAVGGFTAFDNNTTNCFWNTDTSGIATSTSGTPITNTEMTMPCTFYKGSWDFISENNNGTDSIWGMNNTENNGYPFLAWQNFNNTVQDFEQPTISAISDQFNTYNGDQGSVEIIDYTSLVQDSTTENTTTKENLIITQSIAAGTMINSSTEVTVTAQDEAGNISEPITFAVILKPSDLIGEGTEASPYEIANLSHLKWLSENKSVWVEKHFIQTADIDASETSTWNDGAGFVGIGIDNDNRFKNCYYNGNNFEIQNLVINRPSTNYIGLFRNFTGGQISNLSVVDANIVGGNYVGILAGSFAIDNAIIENCFTSGSVSGGMSVGGFVGNFYKASINNSFSSASVIGTDENAGGILGYAYSSTIKNIYSTGQVVGNKKVGGLIGYLRKGTVDNSYCTGVVSGNTSVGGFTGYILENPVVTNSFWDVTLSGQTASTSGTGKTTAEMTMPCTFSEGTWDFISESNNGTDSIWGMDDTENNGYPFLAWQNFNNTVQDFERPTISTISDQFNTYNGDQGSVEIIDFTSLVKDSTTENTTTKENLIITQSIAAGIIITSSTDITVTAQDEAGNLSEPITFAVILKPSDLIGEGTEASPYEIANLSHLKWLSENTSVWVGKYFIQTNDINAKDTENWNNGKGFACIGSTVEDANGECFEGSYDGQGHIIDSLYINRPTETVIGLFASCNNCSIKKLGLTNATVTGSNYVGILKGVDYNNLQSTVDQCFTTGVVAGGYSVGGLIGHSGRTILTNSYSTAQVNAVTASYVGGLCGTNFYYSSTSNCYSTGLVNSSNNNSGLSGLEGNSTVNNSFWDLDSSMKTTSAGGTGKTTAYMHSPSTFADAGWDFVNETNNGSDDVWGINPDVNGGYPFLTWQGLISVADYVKPVVSAINDQVLKYSGADIIASLPSYIDTVRNCASDNMTAKENLTITQSIAAGTMINSSTEITVTVQDETGNVSESVFTINLQPSDLIGEGTEASPYEIANLSHLKWLSETSTVWDKHISQTADINAKDTETWNEGKGFSSIGTRATLFSGVYNGNGHIIDSLYINRPEQNNTSFFGVTKASSTTNITKLGLTNVNITGYDGIGGFLGTGEEGSTNRAVISECFVTGKVNGHYAIGGFTGGALAMQITNCYSIVEINATGTCCGGFAGTSWYGLIDNCYNTGKISVTTTYVGGFTAYDYNATHSFWDTETSGIDKSTCGTGKATIDMHSPSTFADAGWDFINETNNGSDDIWGINPDVNGGYPFLTWQGLTSVGDYVKPVVFAIANQEVLEEANSTSGILPNFIALVNATDNVTTSPNFEVSQLPAAGTVISGENNTITITVKDEAANYNTTTFTVKVVNKAPVFNDISSTLSIPENSSVGTTLLTVSATDDNSDDLCFSTTATMVAVDAETGVVTILDASYFEKGKGASVSFEVKVSDGDLEDIETVTVAISTPTSVSRQWSIQDVVLYPNPAMDNVTLKLPKFENEVVIELVNVNGAVVLKQNVLNEKTSFNTSNLCSGMYILLITTDNTTIQKQLLIK